MISSVKRLSFNFLDNISSLTQWRQGAMTLALGVPALFYGWGISFLMQWLIGLCLGVVDWECLLVTFGEFLIAGLMTGLPFFVFRCFTGDEEANPFASRQTPTIRAIPPRESAPPNPIDLSPVGPGGTYLAYRTEPQTRSEFVIESPFGLFVGCVLILISLKALVSLAPIGLLAAVGGIAFCWYSIARQKVEIPWPPMPGGDEGHQLATDLLSRSTNSLERSHSFVGWVHGTCRRVPVLLDDSLAKMHVHITGATGTFKTYKAALTLFCQLVTNGNNSGVYIDLKGGLVGAGNALYWILRFKALAYGIKFYSFSINPNEACHLMNPLQDPAFLQLSDNQKAQIIAQAVGLENGEGSGAGYFGSVAEMLLKRLFATFRGTGRALSFRSLLAFLSNRSVRKDMGMTRRDFDNASHAFTIVDKLAEDGRLNMVGTEPINPELFEHAITIDKIAGEPAIVYLRFTSQIEPTTSRCLARLFVRILIARLVNWSGSRVDHIYVAIDECQEMLSRGILTPLRQARSLGMSFILVHQTLADLKREDMDYTDHILGNTAVKIMMSVRDEKGRDHLGATGGEKISELLATSKTVTKTPAGESEGEGEQTRQTLVPRFDADEINRINATSELAVFEASPMSGYTRFDRPTIIEIPFSKTALEFAHLDSLAWPEPDGVRTVRSADLPPPAAPVLVPVPMPSGSPSRATAEKRVRRSRERTPEEAARAGKVAEALREAAKKRINDEFPSASRSARK